MKRKNDIDSHAPYKAAVVRLDDDGIHVFVQLRNGEIMDRSIGMTDHDGYYAKFTKFDVGLAWLHVKDGTKPVSLESIITTNPYFEDIFFEIRDACVVCLYDNKNKKVPVRTIMAEGELEDSLIELFDKELELLNPVKHN